MLEIHQIIYLLLNICAAVDTLVHCGYEWVIQEKLKHPFKTKPVKNKILDVRNTFNQIFILCHAQNLNLKNIYI